MRLLMVAPPGAGKGTQATRLATHFGVTHISSGDLLRAEVAAGTALGVKVDSYLHSGDLVPDDLLRELIRDAVQKATDETGGYILDGYPRNVEQAELAYEIGKQMGVTLHAAIHLHVRREELIRRMSTHVEGRTDDDEATIRHRLEVFDEVTLPLLDYYEGRGVLVTVNGEQSVEDVTAETLAKLARVPR
jgi:adenylate kinase